VEQITGQKPLEMREWITRNKSLFVPADEAVETLSTAS
jgi:hypothetical protein